MTRTGKRTTVTSEAVPDVELTLSADRGFHGTALSQIVEALKLGIPSLYNHAQFRAGPPDRTWPRAPVPATTAILGSRLTSRQRRSGSPGSARPPGSSGSTAREVQDGSACILGVRIRPRPVIS